MSLFLDCTKIEINRKPNPFANDILITIAVLQEHFFKEP